MKKPPLFTVETHVCHLEQWVFVQVHVSIIDTTRARRSPPFLLSIEADRSGVGLIRASRAGNSCWVDPAASCWSIPVPSTSVPTAPAATSTPIPTSPATAATISTTTATATAVFAGLCLVHRQTASVVFLVVQSVDGREGIGVRCHLDEAEAAAATCLPVLDDLSTSHFAKRREQLFQVGVRDREREIADIQLLTHRQTPQGLETDTLTRSRLSGSNERGRAGRPIRWARRSRSMTILALNEAEENPRPQFDKPTERV